MTHSSAATRRPRNPRDRQALGVPNFSRQAASKEAMAISPVQPQRMPSSIDEAATRVSFTLGTTMLPSSARQRDSYFGRVHRPRMTQTSAARRRSLTNAFATRVSFTVGTTMLPSFAPRAATRIVTSILLERHIVDPDLACASLWNDGANPAIGNALWNIHFPFDFYPSAACRAR